MRSPSNLPQPTRQLGQAGRDLWDSIQSEFCIEDAGGIEVLMTACQALDRAESLAAQIAADGMILEGPSGASKVHPCVPCELSARTLAVRCLQKLGILHETILPVGKGPGGRRQKGWGGLDADE